MCPTYPQECLWWQSCRWRWQTFVYTHSVSTEPQNWRARTRSTGLDTCGRLWTQELIIGCYCGHTKQIVNSHREYRMATRRPTKFGLTWMTYVWSHDRSVCRLCSSIERPVVVNWEQWRTHRQHKRSKGLCSSLCMSDIPWILIGNNFN